MRLPSTYTLDTETIKLNSYRLLCLFFANKEIARYAHPEDPDDAAASLERTYFAREMTQLLLNIAIALRVLDDQVRALPDGSLRRKTYLEALEVVNRQHKCMMFDGMPLREVCNKIIHATTVEPHTQEGLEPHRMDEYEYLAWAEEQELSDADVGPHPDTIEWQHLTGNIRLGGRKGKEPWWQLLQVPTFVEAVFSLIKQIEPSADRQVLQPD